MHFGWPPDVDVFSPRFPARFGRYARAFAEWLAVENDHTHLSVFRAVENGFGMLRPDAKGISLAVDPLGRELARDSAPVIRLDTARRRHPIAPPAPRSGDAVLLAA